MFTAGISLSFSNSLVITSVFSIASEHSALVWVRPEQFWAYASPFALALGVGRTLKADWSEAKIKIGRWLGPSQAPLIARKFSAYSFPNFLVWRLLQLEFLIVSIHVPQRNFSGEPPLKKAKRLVDQTFCQQFKQLFEENIIRFLAESAFQRRDWLRKFKSLPSTAIREVTYNCLQINSQVCNEAIVYQGEHEKHSYDEKIEYPSLWERMKK